MPWYAQQHDLPDTHRHHADEGGQLARVYDRLGYVQVPAPGAGEPEETGVEAVERPQPAVVEDASEPTTPTRRRQGRHA